MMTLHREATQPDSTPSDMWFIIPALLTIHVIVCILIVTVVLMQRPRSEGLGAAFGGGMTENMFGAQTTHVLSKFTTYLGLVFFALTLLLAVLFARQESGKTTIEKQLLSAKPPAAAASPAASASPSPAKAP